MVEEEEPLYEIGEITFGVANSQVIVRNSVVDVNIAKLSVGFDSNKRANTVYDNRMGVIDDTFCVVCKEKSSMCNGHFGSIKLHEPVLNPLFIKYAIQYLRMFCIQCCRILYNGTSKIVDKKKIEKVELCPHCAQTQPKITLDNGNVKAQYKNSKTIHISAADIYNVFDRVTDDDATLLNITDNNHPRNLVLNYFPVAPIKTRPCVISDAMTCDDDLTVKYVEILKANKKIQKAIVSFKDNPQSGLLEKEISNLEFHIKTFIDNSAQKAKYINGRPMKSIKERLSGKGGLLRNHMMGKRVNFSGRSVIGPDPTLDCFTVGIPHDMCKILTKQTIVNSLNLHKMQALCDTNEVKTITKKNGNKINVWFSQWDVKGTQLYNGDIIERAGRKVKYSNDIVLMEGDSVLRCGAFLTDLIFPKKKKIELEVGDTIEKCLSDGDVILLNRQPTLHKGSMMSFCVKRLLGKSIRMNLAVTKSFNADFDGDEMNIHVPQSILADVELRSLSSVEANFIRPQTNKCNIAIVQDSLLALYIMSKSSIPITKSKFQQIVMSFENPVKYMTRIKEIEETMALYKIPGTLLYTPRNLLSYILPSSFQYGCGEKIKIRNGVIISGMINKSIMWNAHGSILQLMYMHISPKYAMDFTYYIQRIADSYMLHTGFSLGLSDCMTSSDIQMRVKTTIKENLINVNTRQTNENLSEHNVNILLNGTKDSGNKIAKDNTEQTNGFMSTISSGSKGDWVNITQITGLLGQQNVSGKRIEYTSYDRTRSLSCFPKAFDDTWNGISAKFESQGFVSNSFQTGLNPVEFFYHAASGREGITDTACKTSDSGYIQRRMIKMLEDVAIQADGTVRHAAKGIVQFVYGGDGLDPSKLLLKQNNLLFCDVKFICNHLNMQYGNEFTNCV
tara:strand:+ start:5749 stop:8451 length:2703 start_codon:yes stop_codon:yes gene_type:complete